MTKQEYMSQLKDKLSIFDDELAKEILDDYEGHFRDGSANGKSEQEICDELGSIDEIVDELKQLYQPKKKAENNFNSTVNDVVNDAINLAGSLADTIKKGIKSGIDYGKKTVDYGKKAMQTDWPKDDVVDAESTKETADNCRRAVIEAGCADVKAVCSEDDEFHLEYVNHGSIKDKMLYHFYGEQKGDTFYGRVVKEQGNSSLFHRMISPEIEITLRIPKDFAAVEIHTSSGDVSLIDIKTEEGRVYTASGDIAVADVECNNLMIESASGDVKLKRVKGKELKSNSKSGDIVMESCLFENGDCASASGDVRGEEVHILKFSANTASGDTHFEKVTSDTVQISSKSGDAYMSQSTVKELRASSISGDAEIENVVAESINVSSVSGDAQIRARANNYQAQSTSGDVEIHAEGDITGNFQTVSGDIMIEIENGEGGYVADMNVLSGDISMQYGEERRYGISKGVYTMGAGRSRLTINSMSGDISIRA